MLTKITVPNHDDRFDILGLFKKGSDEAEFLFYTLIEHYLRSCDRYAHRTMLAYRAGIFSGQTISNEYTELSYVNSLPIVHSLAAQFVSLGVRRGNGVFFHVRNSPAFLLADIALQAIGAIPAAAYDYLTPVDAAHCARLTRPVVMVLSRENLGLGIALIKENRESVRGVVLLEDCMPDPKEVVYDYL